MNGDLLFRILFLVIFVPGAGIRAYYTGRVRATRKKRSMKERLSDTVEAEGTTGAALLMGQGIFLFAALTIYLLLIPGPVWLNLPFPDELRWTGLALGIISLPFLAWVHYILDKHWDISLSLRKDHTLVTTGPYQRIRHPMYTVHIVYFLSWVLVSANLLLLINYLLTLLLITRRIPREEQMLLERFGQEYRDYMKQAGRLLPRLHRGKTNANEA